VVSKVIAFLKLELKAVGCVATATLILTFLGVFSRIPQYIQHSLISKIKEKEMSPFPSVLSKDTLYILITRFEATTDIDNCYGISLKKRISELKESSKLPIAYFYAPDLSPQTKEEASVIQKKYNMDLVLWGSVLKVEKNCLSGHVCFNSEPNKSLMGSPYWKTSPEKSDSNYELLSAIDIEKGNFHVNEKNFNNWLIAVYNIKMGNSNPDLLYIDESLPIEEKSSSLRELGELYRNLSMYDKADSVFKLSIHLTPNDFFSNLGYANVLAFTGRRNEAHQFYYRCLSLKRNTREFSYLLNNAALNRETLLDSSNLNVTDAIYFLETAKKLGLETPTVYYFLGRFYSATHNPKEAYSNYNKCLEIDSTYHECYVYRGQLNMRQNKHSAAIEDLNKATRIVGGLHLPFKYLYRAEAEFRSKLFKDADKDYSLAINLFSKADTNYYFCLTNRALVRLAENRFQDALRDVNEVINSPVDHNFMRNSHFNKSTLLLLTGNYKKALEEIEKLKDSTDLGLIKTKLYCYSKLGEYKNAISEGKYLINKGYDLGSVYSELGDIYSKTENYNTAIICFSKAINYGDNCYYSYRERGNLKYKLGKTKEAIDDYNQAILADSGQHDVYFKRSEARFSLGETEGGIIDHKNGLMLKYPFLKSLIIFVGFLLTIIIVISLYRYKSIVYFFKPRILRLTKNIKVNPN
jgi:tetratricopeptide (TPR) repeat protein